MRGSLFLRLMVLCLALAGFSIGTARGGGVTVITHGFNGNVTDWIIPMADRFLAHPLFPGTQISCYEIEITGGGALSASATFLGGAAPLASDSGEIVVKLDWSSIAGLGGASSTAVAAAAAAALQSAGLIPELGGRALAELPIHLVGHSRGGSVVTEMARLLGAQGVWVDHVTTLDPRPVGLFGDASVATYTNVLYADNFWQDMGDGLFVPNGQFLSGAYNRKLTSLGGGNSSSHSDVHLWYHGTIELTTPATDTQATITSSERTNWWTTPENFGATAGFHYGLIGMGDRLSDLEPAGSGNGRISDGFNRHWDLGGGFGANRSALPANNGLWPNVILFNLVGANPVGAGEDVEFAVYHQSGAAATGTVDLQVKLDPDFNPWNGNEIEIDQRLVSNTGTGGVGFNQFTVALDPLLVAPGNYAIVASIDDGVRERTLHAPEVLVVTPSTELPVIDGATIQYSSGTTSFDVLAAPGQEVGVEASIDLENWTSLDTHVFTAGPWSFSDPMAGDFDCRYYRAYLVP